MSDPTLTPPSLPPDIPDISDVSDVRPLAPPPRLRLLLPALLMLGGMLALSLLGYRERLWLDALVWKDALIIRSEAAPPEGAIPIQSRRLDVSNFSAVDTDTLDALATVEPMLADIDWKQRESLIAIELPEETWSSLLESGALPTTGSNEVLAGALCRLDSFAVNDQTFKVVGTIQSGTPGLAFSYLCPRSEITNTVMNEESMRGWIEPQGQLHIADLQEETQEGEQEETEEEESISIIMPVAPLSKSTSFAALGAIALVVLGGALAHIRVMKRLAYHYTLVRWLMAPAVEHRYLFIGMHALCYGAYFATSIAAAWSPLENLLLLMIVSEIFTSGGLSHIGNAYLSGSVVAAAWATFYNNFLVQTLGMTIVPSLIIPFFGVLKTAVSLALAGFLLAPIWTGYIAKMTFHSVTLSLECEAYIFAAFAISVYVVYIVRWLSGDKQAIGKSVRVIIAGTVISAIILIIAAFYEAATLIAWS